MRPASGDRDWLGAASRVSGEGDFEDLLRRALRSAADGIEPAGDGLTQIFRRLGTPWLVRQMSLLATDCVDLLWLITIWLHSMLARAMSVLAAVGGSVPEALRRLTSPALAAAPISSGRHRRRQARAADFWGGSALKARVRARTAVAWLRPALPAAVTAALVLTGTIAVSQTVVRIEGSSAPAGAASATGDHRQSPQGDLSEPGPAQIIPAWLGTTRASGGGATHQHSCAPPRCPPGPAGAQPETTPPAQPTASPSPSPAPTPTPTPSHHQPHPHPSHSPHLPHPDPAGTRG